MNYICPECNTSSSEESWDNAIRKACGGTLGTSIREAIENYIEKCSRNIHFVCPYCGKRTLHHYIKSDNTSALYSSDKIEKKDLRSIL